MESIQTESETESTKYESRVGLELVGELCEESERVREG